RAKWFGKDIIAGLRNLVGGELKEYTEMLTEAREEALNRMISEAEALDADAVVNVRFMTSQVTQGAAELLAYGTAVKTR
ncbi:MAG: YbjQ family protein, partial [Candidatus Methanoperedens sp.]